MSLRTQHTHPASWMASPTLSDLGDPEWIAQYQAAGGNVRPRRSVEGAEQALLVGPLVEPLSTPTPNFLQRLAPAGSSGGTKNGEATAGSDVSPAAPGQLERQAETVTGESQIPVRQPQGDEVYDAMRARADSWLAVFCSTGQAAMEGARAAILRNESESGAHAATSLRRALLAVADYVEPPAEGTRPDHTGAERGMGAGQYKNRLYVYLGRKLDGELRKLQLVELELTEQRLGALIGALGKAVHAESRRGDLEQLYLTCWALIARIADCAEASA
jgi:hypothetical protein